jgi:hypothetical protein
MSYRQNSRKSSRGIFGLQPQAAWLAIFGLVLFVCLGLAAGGSIAIACFPLGSLAIAWFLYRRYPLLYNGFVWWMWFFGPLVRRLIDFRCGAVTPGPWTLTPTLVTAISIITLIKYLPKTYNKGGLPFILAVACCCYGFLISIARDGFADRGIFLFFEWVAPIAYSFHLYMQWQDYPQYRQNTQRVFLWGVLFMGGYGLIQYVVAPPWDRFWLEQISDLGTLSFGTPEPFGIRVSGGADSPQSFAAMMVAGLIILLDKIRGPRLLATIIGYLSFLLSLARSGWLSWLVSVGVLFRTLNSRLRMRLIVTIFLGFILLVPLSTIPPMSTAIGERVESLSNFEEDDSYRARVQGYRSLIDDALVEFIGKGIKNPIESVEGLEDGYEIGDNGILVLLFSLGWIGLLPYLSNLILLVLRLRETCIRNNDFLVNACYAIVLGILSQLFLKSITNGAMGMILWGFLGIGLSARNYYHSSVK